jgi:hypothetical protein
MHGPALEEEAEVFHQTTTSLHGLGPHARRARLEILRFNLRNEVLQAPHEGLLTQRPHDLVPTFAMVLSSQSPEPRVQEGLKGIS